ncbi:hypothetical protein [Prosthecobacter fluviatilis]|uniref:Uncharacterized protein n=1 Tax=Prosthecobacter fluviatilis TaxID=445931 RepID=A0ABW0KV70_9BACT
MNPSPVIDTATAPSPATPRMHRVWMVLFISYALVSFWLRTHPTAPPPPPTPAPLHIYFGHQYRGQFMSLSLDDQMVFTGLLQTDATTPRAATLHFPPPGEHFLLEATVTSAKAPAITQTEKIHLAKGRHLLIVLTSDSRLNIFQSEKAPDFF